MPHQPGGSGLFWISFVCDPGDQEQAEAAIRSILEEVARDGLEDVVVEKAQRQALSGEINGRSTMSGQASRLGLERWSGGYLLCPALFETPTESDC